MKNLNEFVKTEERARVVSAWKYLPWAQRKFLRLRFQAEVIRNTFDFRRLLYRAMFMGILGILSITSAFILIKAPPAFSAPVLSAYVSALLILLLLKPRQVTI